MLELLHLVNVGPAAEMNMDLAPRLNLITGDNGLGKTLLLDSAWWALTRTWPMTWGDGHGVVPGKEGATIDWLEKRGDASVTAQAAYDFGDALWRRTENSGATEQEKSRQQGSLVVYLRVDGGISIHDPLRVGEDFRLPFGKGAWGTSSAFQFREIDIWNGLELDGKTSLVCEGLVRDVVRWAVEAGSAEFESLAHLVETLAADEQFRLTHRVDRVYVDDARDFPFLSGPGGQLPVAHAPAGLRRVLGLAYLIVWARREHRIAASLKKREPNKSLVLLIDEVENHLHPKWQRTVVPSLLRALGNDFDLQIVATTHSPMVLASMESTFDRQRDAWFDLDLDAGQVSFQKRIYVQLGEIGNWLTSDAFDMDEPRSLDGELAIRAAQDVLEAANPSIADIDTANEKLHAAGLPDLDPFWIQWDYFVKQAKARSTEPQS